MWSRIGKTKHVPDSMHAGWIFPGNFPLPTLSGCDRSSFFIVLFCFRTCTLYNNGEETRDGHQLILLTISDSAIAVRRNYCLELHEMRLCFSLIRSNLWALENRDYGTRAPDLISVNSEIYTHMQSKIQDSLTVHMDQR